MNKQPPPPKKTSNPIRGPFDRPKISNGYFYLGGGLHHGRDVREGQLHLGPAFFFKQKGTKITFLIVIDPSLPYHAWFWPKGSLLFFLWFAKLFRTQDDGGASHASLAPLPVILAVIIAAVHLLRRFRAGRSTNQMCGNHHSNTSMAPGCHLLFRLH